MTIWLTSLKVSQISFAICALQLTYRGIRERYLIHLEPSQRLVARYRRACFGADSRFD
jgi:hypothetical protein